MSMDKCGNFRYFVSASTTCDHLLCRLYSHAANAYMKSGAWSYTVRGGLESDVLCNGREADQCLCHLLESWVLGRLRLRSHTVKHDQEV